MNDCLPGGQTVSLTPQTDLNVATFTSYRQTTRMMGSIPHHHVVLVESNLVWSPVKAVVLEFIGGHLQLHSLCGIGIGFPVLGRGMYSVLHILRILGEMLNVDLVL